MKSFKVYTKCYRPFTCGGNVRDGRAIATELTEYTEVCLEGSFKGIVFQNPKNGKWYLALSCGALVGYGETAERAIETVNQDIRTGDRSLMERQIARAMMDRDTAELLQKEDFFGRFRR